MVGLLALNTAFGTTGIDFFNTPNDPLARKLLKQITDEGLLKQLYPNGFPVPR